MKSPKFSNSISEKKKEIIKLEIKKVVDVIIEGSENADFDKAIDPYLIDYPDFIFILNGNILSSQDANSVIKPVFDLLLNQEFTIASEKYSFLDKTTVLYTSNLKCMMNFKDGNSVLLDPCAMFLLFRKINNDWRVIYAVESYIENPVVK